MELHQLRYFLAVARTRNFSRAAEQCRVAQPSLSQQIMKLEGELEERLFERTKREVSLTPVIRSVLPSSESSKMLTKSSDSVCATNAAACSSRVSKSTPLSAAWPNAATAACWWARSSSVV